MWTCFKGLYFKGLHFSGGAVTRGNKSAIKSKIVSNQQITKELHNPVIKKFEKM